MGAQRVGANGLAYVLGERCRRRRYVQGGIYGETETFFEVFLRR